MAESPGSPLSSHASSEFAEDIRVEERELSTDALPDSADAHLMPPSKRLKIGMGTYSYRSTPVSQLEAPNEDWDISSDTSGDIPNSPPTGPASTQDDEQLYEQVSFCKWRGCTAGELLNMDALVLHIHDDHIGIRSKKYACEWEGCSRMDHIHASGYALRAHMRSHTKEKPFYCALPECDRSFTRSDALAKHMRTVHETEALRPSDPIPRNHSAAQVKPQRLKLIVNAKPPENNVDAVEQDSIYPAPSGYPADLHFTEEELTLPPSQLFRLLRRQLHWSEREGRDLEIEVQALEAKRKEEWQAKELVLTNVEECELAKAVEKGLDHEKIMKLIHEFLPPIMLPICGEEPWYRRQNVDTAG